MRAETWYPPQKKTYPPFLEPSVGILMRVVDAVGPLPSRTLVRRGVVGCRRWVGVKIKYKKKLSEKSRFPARATNRANLIARTHFMWGRPNMWAGQVRRFPTRCYVKGHFPYVQRVEKWKNCQSRLFREYISGNLARLDPSPRRGCLQGGTLYLPYTTHAHLTRAV